MSIFSFYCSDCNDELRYTRWGGQMLYPSQFTEMTIAKTGRILCPYCYFKESHKGNYEKRKTTKRINLKHGK